MKLTEIRPLKESIQISYDEVSPPNSKEQGDWTFLDTDNGQMYQFAGKFGQAAEMAKKHYSTTHGTKFGRLIFRGQE